MKTFQYIINKIQKGYNIAYSDFLEIVNYGSSLGGARPKLSIKDNNKLWIAKFSSIHDEYDNPAREVISLALVKKCGITVPDFKLYPIASDKSVLLVERFDRNNRERLPFLTAKTFLVASDGESNNYSYLDIAAIIESTAINTTKSDLKELWQRMIFNVLIGNKDDHLRNHGFLYKDKTWRLSPVFDLEISVDKKNHSLALDDMGSLNCSIKTIISMAEYYGISANEAKESIIEIFDILNSWEAIAISEFSIPRTSINKMPKYKEYKDEILQIKKI